MIFTLDTVAVSAAGSRQRADGDDEYICWSRMQAEAGQPLEAIIARKEIERRAGGGMFLWGVGNAPAAMINGLVRAKVPVKVIFSIMKSRPKLVDSAPTRTLAWRRYIDVHGVRRDLPQHVLVTGRGDTLGGIKRFHYALMCRSDAPLVIRRGEVFDPDAFRNAGGTGAPVGASQVTALLRRVRPMNASADYEANIVASLTGSYWVRLIDPIEMDVAKRKLVETAGELSATEWCHIIARIRSGPPADQALTPEGALL